MGMPQNLVTSDVTAHSFRVSWSPAPGNVHKYRVVYVPAQGGEPQEVKAVKHKQQWLTIPLMYQEMNNCRAKTSYC